MARRHCVLFAGNSGAGKDTAADILIKQLSAAGVTSHKLAFADPIKAVATHLLGIPPEVAHGSQQAKLDYTVFGKTARQWLRWIGTEVGRDQIDPNIWVHRFAERAIALDVEVVVGSDCRFINEIDLTRELLEAEGVALVVIKIVNPRVPVDLSHRSEFEIYQIPDDKFSIVIHNTDTLRGLEETIRVISQTITSSKP